MARLDNYTPSRARFTSRKDRSRGKWHRWNRRLTESEVRTIREELDRANALRAELKNLTHKAIGERFGVAHSTISAIAAWETYKWIR